MYEECVFHCLHAEFEIGICFHQKQETRMCFQGKGRDTVGNAHVFPK